jgi:ABC-type multidrug transport system fused ATPase/permease subunit
MYVSLKFDKIYHKWWEQSSQDRRKLMYFDSVLSNTYAAAEVRLFDLGGRFRSKYASLRDRMLGEKLSQMKRKLMGKMFANILILLTSAGAIIWIALRVYSNTATLGDLVVFYQIFSRGQSVMSAMLGSIGQTFSISLYLENLFSYLNLNSKIVSPANPVPFPKVIKHGISFKNIKFHYPGEEKTAYRTLICLFRQVKMWQSSESTEPVKARSSNLRVVFTIRRKDASKLTALIFDNLMSKNYGKTFRFCFSFRCSIKRQWLTASDSEI